MATVRKDGKGKIDQTPRQVFQFWKGRGVTQLRLQGMTDQSVTYNPEFAEWLMGFPRGWSALGAVEMPKFRQWLHSHGISSPKTEERKAA